MDVKSSTTDLVSDADRAAEDAIVALLSDARPDDGLLGEEGSSSDGSSGRRWVVDPLDGTTNFLYGIPQWAVSIALEDADGELLGVVLDPLTGELFRATRGGGTELDGRPVRVRDCDDLSRALIATGFSYDPDARREQAAAATHILPRVRDIRRAGAASLDLAWLAAGRLDGYFERGLKPWDWAAGRLLVTEAGGEIAVMEGEPLGLVAASPALLPDLRAVVAQAGRVAT